MTGDHDAATGIPDATAGARGVATGNPHAATGAQVPTTGAHEQATGAHDAARPGSRPDAPARAGGGAPLGWGSFDALPTGRTLVMGVLNAVSYTHLTLPTKA